MKINRINTASSFSGESKKSSLKKNEANNNYKNVQELSNVCYKPISFGRKLQDHRSWGLRFDPNTKEASFKIFTYPDSKRVTAIVEKAKTKETIEIELENKGGGIFEKKGIRPDAVSDGDKYEFRIYKGNGDVDTVKDPYSFKQQELLGKSTAYDHSKFQWKNDEAWKNSPNRISRTKDNAATNSSVSDLRIFALNPDTFTDKRSYEGIIDKLDEIKDHGFNAIEVMHVENTFLYNWGYDGVDKMSPSEYLGGPDKLKKLVDAAHEKGLNVIFDIVPNHLGPDGAQLEKTGPYIKGPNDFGSAFNLEGENSEYVRDFIVNSALNWVDNYHVDGLRLDMTKYMNSDKTLKLIAAEMNYHFPDTFLIAEDGRDKVGTDGERYWGDNNEIHDKRVIHPLKPEEYGKGKTEDEHASLIQKMHNGEGNLSRLGMDSEWDFAYYHKLDETLYTNDIKGLIKTMMCAQGRTVYVESHDEIGNFEGTRKIAKLMVPKLRLNDNIMLTATDKNRASEYASMKGKNFGEAISIVSAQKAQLASEKLAIKFLTGELDKYKGRKRDLAFDILLPLGISPDSGLSYNKIRDAFEQSKEQYKMATTITYSIPSPKMVFQGNEKMDITPFRFFRQFQSVPRENYLYTEKGYPPAMSALEESTLDKIPFSDNAKVEMDKFSALTKDLNKISLENNALNWGHIDESSIIEHPISGVLGYKVKCPDSDNEIFVVSNFGQMNYGEDTDNEYYLKFPKGQWVEILNTNDEKYGGNSEYLNKNQVISGNGYSDKPLNMAEHSVIFFKRAD